MAVTPLPTTRPISASPSYITNFRHMNLTTQGNPEFQEAHDRKKKSEGKGEEVNYAVLVL